MFVQGKVRRNSGGGYSNVAKDQSNYLVAGSSEVSLIFRKKRMIYNRERVLLDPLSNFTWVRSCGNFR